MSDQNFIRTQALNNIPKIKLKSEIARVNATDLTDQEKNVKIIAINRYYTSNIPVEYWDLSMSKHFKGDNRLFENYKEYVKDLNLSYISGRSICYAGSHGLGKTLTISNILKRCCEKGYTCTYTNLSDMVNVLTNNHDEKFDARKELLMVDFLAIDEFDSRFMPSENAADLYARSLENIFRVRAQNKMPTIMATNSPNVIESFNGTLKASVESLFSGYISIFPVFGNDFRKSGDK